MAGDEGFPLELEMAEGLVFQVASRNRKDLEGRIRMKNRTNHLLLFMIRTNQPLFFEADGALGLLDSGASTSTVITLRKANADFLFESYNNGTMEYTAVQFQVLAMKLTPEESKSVQEASAGKAGASAEQDELRRILSLHSAAERRTKVIKAALVFTGATRRAKAEEAMAEIPETPSQKLSRRIDAVRDAWNEEFSRDQALDPVPSTPEAWDSELRDIHKRYISLVKDSVGLTGDRDALRAALRQAYDRLKELEGGEEDEEEEGGGGEEEEEEEGQQGEDGGKPPDEASAKDEKNGEPTGDEPAASGSEGHLQKSKKRKSKKETGGFNAPQILVVAIAAFFIGRLFPLQGV
mmetsp:Transcript_8126/g.23084  ORF Transcript_8126/g.23084 Transcript_8126/m.23084 type:complete len:351 (-) Transcript_8126:321-1373(-)|eukprot:CAMPEP_0118972762 /NCGR_PEP_ID=MMETSP1173-20130426/8975_1 /TAXON_ID=1034831 /ORGANISM="Rhizochromulina marina cf, Strain CCMP1243" /LENGTH=350 /DNA_ID=CAMNT_0006922337 /DNA_START=85 /DNA_END=1137 /DNA_ORIENTATION=+